MDSSLDIGWSSSIGASRGVHRRRSIRFNFATFDKMDQSVYLCNRDFDFSCVPAMKGKRTDLGTADCAIARTLQVIGDWWSLLIVREAFFGHQRFSEFQRELGLAKNILSARLKKLVEAGILKLEPEAGSSTRNRYVLTEKGRGLHTVLIALWQWGETSCFAKDELRYEMVDSNGLSPLAKLEPKASDGRRIGPSDFTVTERVLAD